MKHEWKVGDAYTTKEWTNLNIVGRITSVGVRDRVQGAEMWYKGGQSLEFHTDRWYKEEQLIPLVPEYARLQQLDQTINDPDSCMPGCPEHQPIDQFDPNIKYS